MLDALEGDDVCMSGMIFREAPPFTEVIAAVAALATVLNSTSERVPPRDGAA